MLYPLLRREMMIPIVSGSMLFQSTKGICLDLILAFQRGRGVKTVAQLLRDISNWI
jgi:hypothetical protein